MECWTSTPEDPQMKSMIYATVIATFLAAVAGCTKDAGSDLGAPNNPSGQKQVPAAPPSAASGTSFENIRVEERQAADPNRKDWSVRATLVNNTSTALDGGDFVIELSQNGETRPFAVHSTQVYFSPAVPARKSTSFVAQVPALNVSKRPAVSEITAQIRLVKTSSRPKVAAGWKPLDPTTAKATVVGQTFIIGPDGKRIAVAPSDPKTQQQVAEASNPFKEAAPAATK